MEEAIFRLKMSYNYNYFNLDGIFTLFIYKIYFVAPDNHQVNPDCFVFCLCMYLYNDLSVLGQGNYFHLYSGSV